MIMHIILDHNDKRITTTTTLSEIKGLIRHLESQGYVRESTVFDHHFLNVRASGGIPLVKNTCSAYETVAIYINRKAVA